MVETVMSAIGAVSEFLWDPAPWVLLFAGVLFTLWIPLREFLRTRKLGHALSGAPQATALTHGVQVVRGVYDDPDDPGAINHFQALSAALSATVGLGNIGGVALAIAAGGPGAVVWMWLVGFLGMALKTAEITLAMQYRNVDDPDNPHGGAMWVVDKVLGGWGGPWKVIGKIVGVFFCITLIISTMTGGNMFQAWNVANLTHGYFQVDKLFAGILLAVLVGLVIIGGIKRIGQVAGRLVPFMCATYVIAGLAVIAMNIGQVPELLGLIFRSAFAPTEIGGAFIGGSMGFAFMQGMKRALFSNEAGQGSAPIAHAAAKTDEPAREGIVGGIGPFIDTICICTLTALVILITNTWNREADGRFGAPLRLERVADAEVPTWSIVGAEDTAALPESRYGEWTAGTSFFVLADVQGAVNGDTRSSRVRIAGTVEEVEEPAGGAAPPGLQIAWSALELSPEDWTGTPTAVSLEPAGGVWRDYGGAQLTGHAFDRVRPGLGKYLVTFSAWLFALSTMISWSYYGEQGMIYMLGARSVLPYKLFFLAGTVWAAIGIQNTDHMIALMDLGTGAMLWSNLPIVLVLGFLAVRCLNDYHIRLKAGEFHPHRAPKITDVVEGHDHDPGHSGGA